jgi:hypothetical protein
MHHVTDTSSGPGVRLGYEGQRHFLANAAGTWEVRFELDQLAAGEIVGVGSVWRAHDGPYDGLVTDVTMSGHVDQRGIARIVLSPIGTASAAIARLVVRLFDGRSNVQDPIISSVLEVEGLSA